MLELVPIGARWTLPYLAVGIFITFAAAVGLGPFSGFLAPPLYGDFEAQRHWLEITTALPTDKWYFYDLQWWGLDYPPLTAYHSRFLGLIGNFIDPQWFELDLSRGKGSRCESPNCLALKAFMRATVLASQLALYLPFVYWYAKSRAIKRGILYHQWIENFLLYILCPSVLVIDNGHFQYNSVMLGLFIGSVAALQANRYYWAALLFTASLFFKQMALFWAPIIFFYILGQNPPYTRQGFLTLATVGAILLGSSALLLSPWLTSKHQILQVFTRVFPFARGLWEDKVANFWCATNTFFKYKTRFDQAQLQRLATIATLIAILPSSLAALFCRSASKLTLAFASCSWAFYLFGFQVHEKSVLVPLAPTTLLLFENNKEWSAMVQWINNIAYYSMWPLLRREGLHLQYFSLAALWNYKILLPSNWFNRLLVLLSYAAIAALTAAEHLDILPMAAKYPDLWTVANISLSFACFAYTFSWLNYQLYSSSDSPQQPTSVKRRT